MTFGLGIVPTYATPFVSFWYIIELCRNCRDCFLSIRANSKLTANSQFSLNGTFKMAGHLGVNFKFSCINVGLTPDDLCETLNIFHGFWWVIDIAPKTTGVTKS